MGQDFHYNIKRSDGYLPLLMKLGKNYTASSMLRCHCICEINVIIIIITSLDSRPVVSGFEAQGRVVGGIFAVMR
jgi:hypothetical protein